MAAAGSEPLLGQAGTMPPAWRWAWTLCLWYVIAAIGVALGLLGPTLQDLTLDQLQLPLAASGSIFSFRASGYLLGSVWCGDLIRRSGNPALVNFLPFLPMCLGMLLLPNIDAYLLTGAIFMTQGMSMGVLDTGGNVCMLSLWRSSKYQNGFVHAFHFLFGAGAALAPALVAWMLTQGERPMAVWPLVGLGAIPGCACLGALVVGPQPETEPDADGGVDEKDSRKIVALTGLFLFVYVGVEVAFGGYIDLFSVRQLGASEVEGATLTSAFWLALSAGRFLAAVTTPFVHHATYLGAHILLAIFAIAALGVVAKTGVVPGTAGYTWGVVLPVSCFGLGLAPLFPGALLVAEELLRGPMPARQTGFVVGAAAAGELLLPAVLGVCFARDAMAFCWLQLSFCLACAVVFLANSASLLWKKA